MGQTAYLEEDMRKYNKSEIWGEDWECMGEI